MSSIVHGHATKIKTKTYNAWRHIIQRCNNSRDVLYKHYGGRGIRVCKRWMKFINFLNDMGIAPKNKSIDRINNNKGYFKNNCRWATDEEQHRNTRKTRLICHNGEIHCLRDWERKLGLGYGTIWRRIKRGFPIDRALEKVVTK